MPVQVAHLHQFRKQGLPAGLDRGHRCLVDETEERTIDLTAHELRCHFSLAKPPKDPRFEPVAAILGRSQLPHDVVLLLALRLEPGLQQVESAQLGVHALRHQGEATRLLASGGGQATTVANDQVRLRQKAPAHLERLRRGRDDL